MVKAKKAVKAVKLDTVALDIGNLQVDIKSKYRETVAPSAFVRSADIGMELTGGVTNYSALGLKLDTFRLPNEDASYIWGEDISNISQKEDIHSTLQFENRYKSNGYQLLMKFALGLIARDYDNVLEEGQVPKIRLVVGLPTDDYINSSYEKDLSDFLHGDHSVLVNGAEYKISVEDVIVLNQSAGTLYYLALDDNGLPKPENVWLRDNIAIVDYGGGTILYDEYELSRLSNNRAQLQMGAYRFFDMVLSAYHASNSEQVAITPLDIQMALREGNDKDGYFYKPNRNRAIDITAEVKSVKDTVTKQVLAKFFETFKKASSIKEVVFTGGGANLVNRSLVEEKFKPYGIDITYLDDSELANVRGYYKAGLAKGLIE